MTDPHTPERAFADAPLSAEAVLRWYAAAGVDVAVGETPIDRTLPPPAAAPMPEAPSAAAAPERRGLPSYAPTPAAPTSAPAVAAPSLREIGSLDDLRRAIEAFDACGLKRTATRTVFGDGPAHARLMVIGEAPGADEDRSGVPFVGRAGQLLDKMLASIGLPRAEVYITNIVPWRPPGNRNPTAEEVTLCRPFILRHIELVAPQVILLLGASAAGAILDLHQGITRIRGEWREFRSGETGLAVPTLPTFHPAYLLRAPAQKALAWRDFLEIRERLSSVGE